MADKGPAAARAGADHARERRRRLPFLQPAPLGEGQSKFETTLKKKRCLTTTNGVSSGCEIRTPLSAASPDFLADEWPMRYPAIALN